MSSEADRARDLASLSERIRAGGAPKYHEKLAQQGKLFVRDRLALLLDSADRFVEEGLLVNALAGDLPADGVVTGVGDDRSPSWRTTPRSRRDLGARGPWRRSSGSSSSPATTSTRSSTWSTPPAPASRIRSISFPAAGVPGRSSTTRSRPRAAFLRSVVCSVPRPRAAPTSPHSVTWCSWSRATHRCISVPRAWPRRSSGRR
jgi:hypothetical protein